MAGLPAPRNGKPRTVAERLSSSAAPMDVYMNQAGHPQEWYNSANAGGVSWNPDIWTINPGPMNTGHRTPPASVPNSKPRAMKASLPSKAPRP